MAVSVSEDQEESKAPESQVTSADSHRQILKSSALVGGSQLINVVIGIARTKAIAIILGPAGFGLFGLYNSVSSLIQTIAGLGVNSSGVREIAAAVSRGHADQIAHTASALRKVGIALGAIGALLTILLAAPISKLTFNTDQHAASIRWLSLAVFLLLIAGSQSALIQGMRRLKDLAKMQVIGSLAGMIGAVSLTMLYRERGIVPSLILVAATGLVTSWWFSRGLASATPEQSFPLREHRQVLREVASLLKLGVAFMLSSCITLGIAYAIRICILRSLGMAATGLYQSAWTLGGFYVGVILQAMGADFYPRLTAVAEDNALCNRLVNEQTLVGLVVAGPGVVCSLTLAPVVISVFYSAKFFAAISILRWVCLGAFLQVISFPIGYVIIAKAKRALFIACEVAWGVVSLALAYSLIPRLGLRGAGITYCLSYCFHCLMIWAVVHRLSGFTWSRENVRVGSVSIALIVGAFLSAIALPATVAIPLGAVILLLSVVYSSRILTTMVPMERVPPIAKRLLTACHLMPRRAGLGN